MTGSIYNWSTTAASNANADGDINFAEGQAPSTVNNSARQVMGRLAEIMADQGGALVAGGTSSVLTVTTNSAFTAYQDGLILALRITTDNPGAATLNANALGAKSIRKMLTTGEAALSGNEMQATGIYLFRYSTALNSAAGGWLLLNPTIDLTPYATLASPALTGNPTAPTPTAGDNDTSIATTAFATAAIATAIAALSTVYQGISTVLTALAGIGAAVAGDVIYSSGAGVWARLAKGTARQAFLMNAGATAPAWTTLPFSQSFESAQQTITLGGSLTLAHGLGVTPKLYSAFLQCTTADTGFSVGMEIPVTVMQGGTNGYSPTSIVPDATNINIRFASSAIRVNRWDNGNDNAITTGSWRLVVRAWA